MLERIAAVPMGTAAQESFDGQSAARAEYINAMASAANGVAIVTTDGDAGRFGITVSSASSVSADPPLLLVCIDRKSPAHRAVRANGAFCLNLLSTGDRELADTFAGRATRGLAFEFARGAWSPGTVGAPRLSRAIAAFDCRVDQAHDAGSHTVFIGRVVAVNSTGGDPLLYANRTYRSACPLN